MYLVIALIFNRQFFGDCLGHTRIVVLCIEDGKAT